MSQIKKEMLLFFIIPFVVITGCEGGKMTEKGAVFSSINTLSESQLNELSRKKIYFGHMSVGYNIVDGINDLIKENPRLKINVIESKDPSSIVDPVFAHSAIGNNVDPKSKLADFVQLVESGMGQRVDIAFFKFCYVDVESSTDVAELFKQYKNAMSNLKRKYPKVTFVHVTVPLTIVQTGWKAHIKRILGKPLGGYADNVKRNEYNELLKKEYIEKEPVVDLAAFESTDPKEGRSYFTVNGRVYHSLFPSYTSDGGHLNEKARRLIAEQLLVFLAMI